MISVISRGWQGEVGDGRRWLFGKGGGHFLFEGSYPCMVSIGHTVYRFWVYPLQNRPQYIAVAVNAVQDRKKGGCHCPKNFLKGDCKRGPVRAFRECACSC